jgi:hypothetical protein
MTSVVVIISLFFVFGIAVGIIAVIAMSALRRYKLSGPPDWSAPGPSGLDEQPPDLEWDNSPTEDRSWWKARDDD